MREALTVNGGNELVIGILLSGWLAATALGSESGRRLSRIRRPDTILFCTVLSALVIPGIRGCRLLVAPGEMVSPAWGVVLSLLWTMLPSFTGGLVFGAAAATAFIPECYRKEQVGSLAGLVFLTGAVSLFLPHGVLVAAAVLPVIFSISSRWLQTVAVLIPLLLVVTDQTTSQWKYPMPVGKVVYSHEGEVACIPVDEHTMVFVNGRVKGTGFQTPGVEKAVHTACTMHPKPERILVINSTGERAEAEKYGSAVVDCIRTDYFAVDSGCPYATIRDVQGNDPYDVIVVGGGIPATIGEGRWLTLSTLEVFHRMVGDSGVVTYTLPFTSEIPDRYDQAVRDVLLHTLKTVFSFVRVVPAEGVTFVASDTEYPFPDTCRVSNDFFSSMVLPVLTSRRLEAANTPPATEMIHTVTRPVLLYLVLDRYVGQFRMHWWLFIVLPVLFTGVLLVVIRPDRDMVSIATSGFSTGVFSVAGMLLFQGIYGTLYVHLAFLMLSLATGFTIGGFVHRLKVSDAFLGIMQGGILCGLAVSNHPPVYLFCVTNVVAGALSAAQFVTLQGGSTARKYTADCTGGIIGMAVTSTLLVPQWGILPVAAGMVLLKGGVFLWRSAGISSRLT